MNGQLTGWAAIAAIALATAAMRAPGPLLMRGRSHAAWLDLTAGVAAVAVALRAPRRVAVLAGVASAFLARAVLPLP